MIPSRSNPLLHEQKHVAAWALACAERALPVYEREHGRDWRPRHALDAVRAWMVGGADADAVRAASLAAHAAARESSCEAARLSARSAAQAAGVVQSVRHAPHAASYARRAIAAAGGDADTELAWQRGSADDVVKAFLLAQIQQPARTSGATE